MKWKIYYGDGSTHTNEDPLPIPPCDVQVILQDAPDVRKELVTNGDYYLWRDGRWIALNFGGLLEELLSEGILEPRVGLLHNLKVNGEWKKVDIVGLTTHIMSEGRLLLGRMISKEKYTQCMRDAIAEKKKGWLPRERRE
jgi:hypothetical protein